MSYGRALALALKFHEAYERLAPQFGYATRDETKAFDPESPNGRLMIAVCTELLPETDPANIQDLLDALAHKPESQCYVQQLAEAITNIQVSARRVGMSKISFVSNQLSPSEFMANTGKVGFVVWVARDRLS